MKDLNQQRQQTEYLRVMEKRIRYYAEKYDPHTHVYDPTHIKEREAPGESEHKGRIGMIRTILTNIF